MKKSVIVSLLIVCIVVVSSCSESTYIQESTIQTTNSQTTSVRTTHAIPPMITQPTASSKIGPDVRATHNPQDYAYIDIIESCMDKATVQFDWDAILSVIPSDKYIVYDGYPTMPLKAMLYRNGEAEELSTDDPRLVKLMNFYYNAQHHNICAVSQGVASTASTIASITVEEELYLEIQYDIASYHNLEEVDFYAGFDILLVMPHEFMEINSDTPFEKCPFTALGRYPLYGYKGINWLTLFGFE